MPQLVEVVQGRLACTTCGHDLGEVPPGLESGMRARVSLLQAGSTLDVLVIGLDVKDLAALARLGRSAQRHPCIAIAFAFGRRTS